jgi:hypothetical protein
MVTGTDRRAAPDGWPWRAALLFAREWWSFSVVVLASAAITVAVWGWRSLVFGLVGATLLMTAEALRGQRPGVAVDAGRWPGLESLVLDIAARTGVQPPSGVWLTGDATVSSAVVGRRRYLLIGRPLLRCLTAGELAALIGAELAVLAQPHPWLVTRLFAKWAKAADDRAEPDAKPSRRRTRILASYGALGTRIREQADRAAVLAAGDPCVAARALILSRMAFGEYWYYLIDAETVSDPFFGLKSAINDVDDGWHRLLRHGLANQDAEEEAAIVAALHPALAEEAGAARPTVVLRDEVAVGPLTEREERRLVRLARNLWPGSVRWRRFADVPPQQWVRRAERDADRVREAAYVRLRRGPVDDVEVAATLTDLPRETAAILVEAGLLPTGWRLEHPAVRGVLRGPQGQAVDVNALAARAAMEPAARAELDALLRGQPAAAATAAATSARAVGSDQGPTR